MTTKQKWLTGLAIVSGAAAVWAVRRGVGMKAMLDQYNAPQDKALRSTDPTPGDILLFYRPGRQFDKVVQFFTYSPFYHAALYAGNGRVVEARPKGVVDDNLHGREANFVVAPAPDGRGTEALAWARTQMGVPFSHMDEFVIALEHLFPRWKNGYTTPNHYTCGELITRSFDHAGVALFPGRKRDSIAPGDLACLLPVEAQPVLPEPGD